MIRPLSFTSLDNAIEILFEALIASLRKQGVIINKGSIIDATIVKAPIQRNKRSENDDIKNGNIPTAWSNKKKSHKDIDANWTAKHGKQYFGYKNHVKMDKKTKIITKTFTTEASTSDSKGFAPLLEDDDIGKTMHMDSGYVYDAVKAVLLAGGVKPRIQSRGVRNKPLDEAQMKRNHKLSSIRCRVEHAFGSMSTCFGPAIIRTIGIERARVKNVMRTLTYNIKRVSYLMG